MESNYIFPVGEGSTDGFFLEFHHLNKADRLIILYYCFLGLLAHCPTLKNSQMPLVVQVAIEWTFILDVLYGDYMKESRGSPPFFF